MNKTLYNLTNPQKAIWLTEQFSNGSSLNNISGNIIINDVVNFPLLEKSLNMYIQKNDALRLRVTMVDNTPKQYLSDYIPFSIDLVKLQSKADLDHFNEIVVSTPFTLFDSDLFAFKLFSFPDGTGGLNVTFHHIVSDAWTMSLFIDEVMSIYDSLLTGSTVDLSPNLSYLDYISSEAEYEKSNKFVKDKAFWDAKFTAAPDIAYITGKKKKTRNTVAIRKIFTFDESLYKKIADVCKHYNSSVYTFLMCVYSLYLSKINNLSHFVIGTPVLNRSNFKDKHTAGMFISTTAFDFEVDSNMDFLSYLSNVATNQISIFRHQKYPYSAIANMVKESYGISENLYDVALSYQNARDNSNTSNVNYYTKWLFTGHILDSLEIHFYDMDNSGSLEIYYDYNVDCLTEEDITKMHKRILFMIEQILDNVTINLKQINLLPKSEILEIEENFNNTAKEYDDEISISDLFHLQVQKHPNKPAIIFENQEMSYSELEDRANDVAFFLQEKGIDNNQVVGILLNRGFSLMASVLGCLKAGAAYLLIDPTLPTDRISFMLQNSNSPLLITETLLQKIAFPSILNIDTLKARTGELNYVENKSTDIFCIIYTSGSTGVPKGVTLTRKGILNMLLSYQNLLGVNKCDRFLSISAVSFDMFIVENFVSLLSGKTVILANSDEQKIPVFMHKLISSQNVDFILSTPSKLELLLADDNKENSLLNVKVIQVGGEVFTPSLYERLHIHTNAHIFNGYGPSECTACCSSKEITSSNITIGRPFCNTKIYICNKDLNMLPIGFEGEICVVGDGVGKGYKNNEENTKKSFVPNPFGKGILYRTGDIAKLNNNYELEYVGRRDFQVKLRGLRIELNEIDNQLKMVSSVQNAVSLIQKVNEIDCICSYVVTKNTVSAEELKNELAKTLPYYMVPSHIVFVEEIPLTLNGKIDTKKLPAISVIEEDFVEASSSTEKKLVEIWKKLLKLDNISIKSNFFELGGDSLCSLRLISDIYSTFSIKLSVQDIFELPTILKLADFIDAKAVTDNAAEETRITKAAKANFYPLSSAQKRIYYTANIEGANSVTYNTPGGILFDKQPNIPNLEKAIKTVLNRHVAFKTYFTLEGDTVVQKILDNDIDFTLPVLEMPYSDLDSIFEQFLLPFDLQKAPLFRAKLVNFDTGNSLLLLDMHHIICDGTSIGIFIDELCKLYNGETLKDTPSIDYLDFAVWENNIHRNSLSFANSKLFWVNQFKNNVPVLDMPTSFARGQNSSHKGKKVSAILDESVFLKLQEVCKRFNTTPYIFLLSVYYVLLYKYTHNEDIVVGSPIVGRDNTDVNHMVGMFVNTLAIRHTIYGKDTFEDFISQMTKHVLECISHQDFPFDELTQNLNLKRSSNRSPLFDTMFIFQNDGEAVMNFHDMNTSYYEPDSHISKFDFSLEITPSLHGLSCKLEYCVDLFTSSFAKRFLTHYMQILNTVLNNTDMLISSISMLTPYEEIQIKEEFNKTHYPFDVEKPIIEIFKEQVIKNPSKTALVFEDTNISYEQLDIWSNLVACDLIKKNIKPKDIVAIKMERSYSIPIAMLGILKAGAAYLVIDPTLPEDRINDMLHVTNCEYMLTSIPDISYEKVPSDFSPVVVDNSYPLSVVFTSGSTGTPKGVLLHRKGMVNLVYGYQERMHINEFEHFANICAVSFDMFAVEVFVPLLSGKTLCIANYEEHKVPTAMSKFIIKNKIDFILITPSKLNLLLLTDETKKCLPVLKSIQTGGEALTPSFYLTIRKYTSAIICNEYGPTETTACCSCKEISSHDKITIGKPLPNVQIYICDKDLNLCPIGVLGELCIAGTGVSYGYINRDDITKKVFTANPFGSGLLYHSGDIAQYNEKGEIVYVGRKDSQIKMHGLRIELAEIENHILAIPGINNCKVIYHNQKNNEYLTAFFTSDIFLNVSKVKMELQKYLPLYMIPRYIIPLNKMPITANGKIDTKALENYKIENIQSNNYVPPKTKIQKTFCNILEKLLSTKVGIYDNLFDIGLDSLMAIKLKVELLSKDIDISYSDIFKCPTVYELANLNASSNSTVDLADYDYSAIHELIAPKEDKTSIVKKDNNNVLLLGANGFVGAHILYSFLKHDKGNIYCIVRDKDNRLAKDRLLDVLHFYFKDELDKYLDNRFFILTGTITKENFGLSYDNLQEIATNVSTVINAAANVKHFGNYDKFKEVNVDSTKNMIAFCLSYKKRFIHLSSLSVSGNSLANIQADNEALSTKVPFSEHSLYIGQDLENVYIRSKFCAEKLILENILKNGLNAQILRLGNITNRFVDGCFQINPNENAFLIRLVTFLNLHTIPCNLLDQYLEFTPVDICSDSIVTVLQNENPSQFIYHIYNHNHLDMKLFIDYIKDLGIDMKALSDKDFSKYLSKLLKNKSEKNKLSGIINDLTSDKKLVYTSHIQIHAQDSLNFFEKVGFSWPVIDKDYIEKYICYLKELKFI